MKPLKPGEESVRRHLIDPVKVTYVDESPLVKVTKSE